MVARRKIFSNNFETFLQDRFARRVECTDESNQKTNRWNNWKEKDNYETPELRRRCHRLPQHVDGVRGDSQRQLLLIDENPA